MSFAPKLHLYRFVTFAATCYAAFLMPAPPCSAQTDWDAPSALDQDPMPEYQRLIEDGVRFNSTSDFRRAETAYRRALNICQQRFGEEAPICNNAMIRLGLEMSNQGNFEEADKVFGLANRAARRSVSPYDIPRYLIYRAMDMSNRDELDRARRMALASNKRYSVLLKAEVAAIRPGDGDAKKRMASLLLEFANGLYVHAVIARKTGRIDEASSSVKLAKDIAARIRGVPQGYLDDLDKVLKTARPLRRQLSEQREGEPNSE